MKMINESDRVLWIDVLNIVACMGVVLLHCTNGQVHGFNGHVSFEWTVGLFTHSAFLWPVNVFFMLSGLTLMRKSIFWGVKAFYVRRLKRLLIPVLTWNVVYTILTLASQLKHASITDSPMCIVEKFLSFEYNGFMWFFVPLIVIYLSMPFLALFVLNAQKNILKSYIIISVVLNCIAPLQGAFSSRMTFPDIYLFGTRFLPYIVAGYYIGSFEIGIRAKKMLYVSALLCVPLMIVGTAFLQFNIPSHYKYFIQYVNFPCTIVSFAVFLYFKETDWKRILEKWNVNIGIITKISSLSLGIYLVQMLGFMVVDHIPYVSINPILKFIVMYVGCTFASWSMKCIPILRKIV